MKIRTTKYMVKEGILSAYRNKLMSLASFGIVTASLIVFGIFLVVTINVSNNINSLSEQPEIQAYCYSELDDVQVRQVKKYIESNAAIQKSTQVTKKEAFEKFRKDVFGGKEDLLEGYNESIMPVSFIIKLKNPKDSTRVSNELKKLSNLVEKVACPRQAIEFIATVTYWLRLISGFLLVVLLLISMFIIANTIKLTVFARRREINIMKYIGATDWFIRWPFIIEGAIIGLAGAVFAFILVSYMYNAFTGKFSKDLADIGFNIIGFVDLGQIWVQFIAMYSLIGIAVGSLGSIISVRKHLQV